LLSLVHAFFAIHLQDFSRNMRIPREQAAPQGLIRVKRERTPHPRTPRRKPTPDEASTMPSKTLRTSTTEGMQSLRPLFSWIVVRSAGCPFKSVADALHNPRRYNVLAGYFGRWQLSHPLSDESRRPTP
jgi:hypothetical protein